MQKWKPTYRVRVETRSGSARALRRVLFLAVASGLISLIPQPWGAVAATAFYVVDHYANSNHLE